MNDCHRIKELLVLHAEATLDAAQSREVNAHLAVCATCREEAGTLARIRGWLMDPELFAPEPDYAWQTLPQKLAARAAASTSAKRWLPANFDSFGWALSMAATLVISFGLVWLAHHSAPEPPAMPVASVAPAPGNEAFLKKIQSAYAREATTQYLNECQDLLLNVMRAEKSCKGKMYDVSFEVEQARQLLRRKRMLDVELQSPAIVHAKNLCDELEGFLVNLSTSDKCESPDKMHRMERFIQREKLLLRINVLQSELS